MQSQHVPQRMCRVCRTKKAKHELTRWVIEDGQPVKDLSKSQSGRGIYTCSMECEEKLNLVLRGRKKK